MGIEREHFMITVIVPIYNAEKYLKKCIESILSQSLKNLEIILVDDGSQDRSLSICRSYQDKRIKVIEMKKNSGQVKAYTEGIGCATGEYFAFVDSDDWIAPDMMEILLDALEEDDADIAACGCWHIYENRKVVEPTDIEKINRRVFTHETIEKEMRQLHVHGNFVDEIIKLYRCNKIFKKELILNNIQFLQPNIRVFEDNNIVIPCILDAGKIVYINRPLYYYRRYEGTTMSMFDDTILESNRAFLENQQLIYREKKVQHEIESDAYVVWAYSISRVLSSEAKRNEKIRQLNLIANELQKYEIGSSKAIEFGASLKFAFVVDLVFKRKYKTAIYIGLINKQLKRIRR